MVDVRPTDAAQWSALKETRLRALGDAPEAFGSTLAREVVFEEGEWRRRAASGQSWLAWSEGRAVGIVALMADGDPGERHLVSMWVEPQQRGSGVADELVAAVCERAAADGATAVTLWVADGNARARRFYERCGFRSTGERQPLPSAPEVGEERMRRRLRVVRGDA